MMIMKLFAFGSSFNIFGIIIDQPLAKLMYIIDVSMYICNQHENLVRIDYAAD